MFKICMMYILVFNLMLFSALDTGYYCLGPPVIGVVGYYCYYYILNTFEFCNGYSISQDPSGIRDDFKENLFGQHLVESIVPNVILNHVRDDNPKKALVLSFHGWTGCGKNFVSDIITNHLYRERSKSNFVHKMIAGKDYKHEHLLEQYKKELVQLVEKKTKLCEKNLFIFDEVEKMPVGLLDELKPYLDFNHDVDGVNYRKNIFIFLSNVGGEKIRDAALAHMRSNKPRKEIKAKSMEDILRVEAFTDKGGLKHAKLLTSALVDFQIPFLPLERKHVKMCIVTELQRLGKTFDESIVEKIAGELNYYPQNDPIFSETGCKHVSKKVAGYI